MLKIASAQPNGKLNPVRGFGAVLLNAEGSGNIIHKPAHAAVVKINDARSILVQEQLVVILIGERPGLSLPNSLCVYLTYAPFPGCTDEARNCISNVRPAGLSIEDGVRKLCYLVQEAFARRLTGVNLKDDMPANYLPFAGGGAAIL